MSQEPVALVGGYFLQDAVIVRIISINIIICHSPVSTRDSSRITGGTAVINSSTGSIFVRRLSPAGDELNLITARQVLLIMCKSSHRFCKLFLFNSVHSCSKWH